MARENERLKSTLEQLVNTNKILVQSFAEKAKRPRNDSEDNESPVEIPLHPASGRAVRIIERLPPLVQSDYPRVKFWSKLDWKKYENDRKDSSELEGKGSSARGGTRSAKGENVMMLYIENADGSAISGTLASEIREFARSIWRGFYLQGIGPERWGDASKQIRDEFFREIEGTFTVLRYCDNHWKANAIATSIYSQWYHSFDRKHHTVKEEDTSISLACDEPGPSRKKHKTASKDIEDTHDSDSPQSEGQALANSTNASTRRDILIKDPLYRTLATILSLH
ncbi:hypothetical protein BC826DRAFT_1105790 [Russula brevipes]|nr:hypothetical protein BC826DRAFT_1105790 [Russula brevipes]